MIFDIDDSVDYGVFVMKYMEGVQKQLRVFEKV